MDELNELTERVAEGDEAAIGLLSAALAEASFSDRDAWLESGVMEYAFMSWTGRGGDEKALAPIDNVLAAMEV